MEVPVAWNGVLGVSGMDQFYSGYVGKGLSLTIGCHCRQSEPLIARPRGGMLATASDS